MAEYEPVVGQWYRDVKGDSLFEVVASDEETVEIQHEDGDVEEVELDAWYDMALEPVEEPSDFLGPLDDVSDNDDVSLQRPEGLDA